MILQRCQCQIKEIFRKQIQWRFYPKGGDLQERKGITGTHVSAIARDPSRKLKHLRRMRLAIASR